MARRFLIAPGVALLITIAVGDTTDIVIMLIWTVVFNIVQGSIIAPLVYGKAVSLHPAIVLLAIPAGGQLAGVVGMFLAVPVLGVISASWRSVLQVLGDRPPTSGDTTDPGSPDPPAPEPGLPDTGSQPAGASG